MLFGKTLIPIREYRAIITERENILLGLKLHFQMIKQSRKDYPDIVEFNRKSLDNILEREKPFLDKAWKCLRKAQEKSEKTLENPPFPVAPEPMRSHALLLAEIWKELGYLEIPQDGLTENQCQILRNIGEKKILGEH